MVEKKKILAITSTYYPQIGGAEKATYELYKRLSKKYDIDLIAPGTTKEIDYIENNGYFNIYRVGKILDGRPTSIMRLWKEQIKKATELQEKKKYDYIHAYYLLLGGFPATMSRKGNTPIIITENHLGTGQEITNTEKIPWAATVLMRNIAKKADKIISISKSQDNFLQELGIKDYKTIHLGGDTKKNKKENNEIRDRLGIRKREKVLLAIGRLVPRKAYIAMIMCTEILIRSYGGIHLIIAGRGPQEKELRQIIKELKIQKNIHLMGEVSQETLEKLWGIADAYISNSEYEGAGLTYYEAMSAKVPIIAKKNESTEECIRDNENGILYEQDYQMTRKITELLENPKKMRKIVEEAYKDHKEEYNWDKNAKEFEKVLQEIDYERNKSQYHGQ